MIGLLVPAYIVIGIAVATFGIRRGWGWTTAMEQRPGALIIALFWPAYVLVYGLAALAQLIVNLANPAAYKHDH